MWVRMLASMLAVAAYAGARVFFAPLAAIMAGQAAGQQFTADNSGYIYIAYLTGLLTGAGHILTLGLLVALIVIWWRPLYRLLVPGRVIVPVAVIAACLSPHAAFAYADQTDRTEAYTILPNESAFWVPDIGDNQTTQAEFDSEAALNRNKLAVKRFIIPHQKLSGSGGTAWFSGADFYVPTGRLFIVDRTPYSREWVDANDRGTSQRHEGFPCQSREGLNITVGISIGASVLEVNAAKYLHRFGVMNPEGSRSDIQVIFASVYYSRKLEDVMDDVGRKKVQTLVCHEISTRTFDEANAQSAQIMDTVGKEATDYFASVGITLDFIGWADTFTFDPEVQDAINRRYVAGQDRDIAATLAPYTATLHALAAAKAVQAFGNRTDGKLPTTIVGLPPNVGSLVTSLLQAAPAVPVTPGMVPAAHR